MSIRVKQDTMHSKFYLQLYTKNKKYYTFFFKYIDTSEIVDPKYTYFAVRKTAGEVEQMREDNNSALIENIATQQVVVFLNNKFDQEKEDDNLKAYTKKMTFQEFLDEMKNPQQHILKLTFEKCIDNRTNIDFLPMIYQERSSINTHHLIVYDIRKMKIVRHCNLRGNLEVRDLLRKDDNNFGYYTLTRTSDVFAQQHPMLLSHSCDGDQTSQVVKY